MKIDLSKHPRIMLVVEYAKKSNCLKFSPQAEEIQEEDKQNHIPYRAGFYAEDVTGFWNPASLMDYLKGNFSGYKQGLEFGPFTALKFLSLTIPWSGWVWVVDSLDTLRRDVVYNKIREIKSPEKRRSMNDNFNKLLSEVTEEEVLQELNKYYIQLNERMWVSTSDPSVIVYDQMKKPYNLEHGWSKEQLGEILVEWLEEVSGVKVPYKFVEGASW